ncbi:MAG: hypothetical protein EOO77_28850 [Oxalobacteraceae bacterium]|nr:MAG: hypothetical protein EOO77_28850 [Oxalobacteraceae bacterium]
MSTERAIYERRIKVGCLTIIHLNVQFGDAVEACNILATSDHGLSLRALARRLARKASRIVSARGGTPHYRISFETQR